MNTKKLFYGLVTCLVLMAAACTPTSTAEEDDLYLDGIDKNKIILKNNSIDKNKIILKHSIDKNKIILKNNSTSDAE